MYKVEYQIIELFLINEPLKKTYSRNYMSKIIVLVVLIKKTTTQ